MRSRFFLSTVVDSGTRRFLTSIGTITFDEHRVYGYSPVNHIYAAGDIVIDLTGASTSKKVEVYHRDDKQPSYSGATVTESGDYVEGVLNIIRLDYNGVTVTAAYHNQV